MLLKNLAILLLSFYKFAISPYILSQCCYAISCSDYSKIIIKEKGIILGLLLSFLRLLKCTLMPIKNNLHINNRFRLFIFPILLFVFISCTNFEHQGGWSNVVLDPDNESFFVSSNQGKVFNIVTNDGIQG